MIAYARVNAHIKQLCSNSWTLLQELIYNQAFSHSICPFFSNCLTLLPDCHTSSFSFNFFISTWLIMVYTFMVVLTNFSFIEKSRQRHNRPGGGFPIGGTGFPLAGNAAGLSHLKVQRVPKLLCVIIHRHHSHLWNIN